MKFLKFNLILILSLLMTACSSDDNTNDNTIPDETAKLKLVTTLQNEAHTIEVYSETSQLKVGYNSIYLRVMDDTNTPLTEATDFSWHPMMTMQMQGMQHQHSCPFSDVTKVDGKATLYKGYIVFIMASSNMDTWTLDINYTVNGQTYTATGDVEVLASTTDFHKTLISTTANDGQKYVLALVEPSHPKIGPNPMTVALFKNTDSGMAFESVAGYSILVDPRMPGMGYHSAPGNEDLTQEADGFYRGKVGFSMSGYWEINMVLKNAEGEAIKGEAFSEAQPASSLQFKVEF